MISGALGETTCIDVIGKVAGPYASSLLGDLGGVPIVILSGT
ncbi:MAG: hypothetical protein ACREO5_07955 [Candidatus Binatia bacterium]